MSSADQTKGNKSTKSTNNRISALYEGTCTDGTEVLSACGNDLESFILIIAL